MTEHIDLQYRPATYFQPEALETHLLSSVKSAVLRRQLKAVFEAGHQPELDALCREMVREHFPQPDPKDEE